jgi:tryptophan synthase alpha subunit
MSNPTFKAEGEQEIKKPEVKVVGVIDLSKDTKRRFKKKNETPEIKQEIMQAPTTDPLELVGKTMTHQEFISACGLSYEEIRKHEMK